MSEKPHWRENYPVSQPDEHKVSRRQMARMAGLGVAACACAAALRPALLPVPRADHSMAVAKAGELAPNESKLFHYPTKDHPAILVRLADGSYVAYSQSCTHLMCPVHFDPAANKLVCPCHAGFFDPRDGSVLAGPPPRPLPAFPVTIRNDTVYVG